MGSQTARPENLIRGYPNIAPQGPSGRGLPDPGWFFAHWDGGSPTSAHWSGHRGPAAVGRESRGEKVESRIWGAVQRSRHGGPRGRGTGLSACSGKEAWKRGTTNFRGRNGPPRTPGRTNWTDRPGGLSPRWGTRRSARTLSVPHLRQADSGPTKRGQVHIPPNLAVIRKPCP